MTIDFGSGIVVNKATFPAGSTDNIQIPAGTTIKVSHDLVVADPNLDWFSNNDDVARIVPFDGGVTVTALKEGAISLQLQARRVFKFGLELTVVPSLGQVVSIEGTAIVEDKP